MEEEPRINHLRTLQAAFTIDTEGKCDSTSISFSSLLSQAFLPDSVVVVSKLFCFLTSTYCISRIFTRAGRALAWAMARREVESMARLLNDRQQRTWTSSLLQSVNKVTEKRKWLVKWHDWGKQVKWHEWRKHVKWHIWGKQVKWYMTKEHRWRMWLWKAGLVARQRKVGEVAWQRHAGEVTWLRKWWGDMTEKSRWSNMS